MTIMTSEQIDAMREVRFRLGAVSVASHDIGGGTVWVTMWSSDDPSARPVFSGMITPAGTVHEAPEPLRVVA